MSHFYYSRSAGEIKMALVIGLTPTSATPQAAPQRAAGERRFFTALACAMLVVAASGFLPSILNGASRRAPLSPLVATHGIVFFVWLVLFLIQARFVANGNMVLHKRLGLAAILALALMIPLGYATAISMVRRGFDLSGDLRIDHDPAYEAVFPLGDLLIFTVLVTAAIAYRRRAAIHKRLMLFANVALMGAPLAHLIGHAPWLARMPGAIILAPLSLFLLAAVGRDFCLSGKVHPLTWGLAASTFLLGPLRAALIGPSSAWHALVNWLAR
jgi:hypothetical protein